jgi:hypothetical protein
MRDSALPGANGHKGRRTARGSPVPPVPASSKARPVCVVVIGEFNTGKTTLVNALLGAPVLPASFTTHTAYPTVVRFAARPCLKAEIGGRRRVPFAWTCMEGPPSEDICRLHVGMPLDRLRTLRAVDTPGLGLGDENRDARALRACRSADTVIWCTPATQAWKASERHAWLTLPRRLRQRGVLAVTFMDQIRSKADAGRLLARLNTEAGPHFRKIVTFSVHGAHPLCSDIIG